MLTSRGVSQVVGLTKGSMGCDVVGTLAGEGKAITPADR